MPERTGPSVLLVEDDFLIASTLQMQLEQQGVRVVGPVAQAADALALIATGLPLDCALLDVALGDAPVFPVADALRARGVRFAFLTGYDQSVLPEGYRDAPYFSKLEAPKVVFRWVLGA